MEHRWTWLVAGACCSFLMVACVGAEPSVIDKDGTDSGGASSGHVEPRLPCRALPCTDSGGASSSSGGGTTGGTGGGGTTGGSSSSGGTGGSTSNRVVPCATDVDCGGNKCIGESWCSPASCTTDADCGTSASGDSNRCIKNQAGGSICFPGCSVTADCSIFAGTTCQKNVSGPGSACAAPSTPAEPKAGDPCTTAADCGSLTCLGHWCSPAACVTEADCGSNTAGRANHCIENKAGAKVCFPSCVSSTDCAAYATTTCQAAVVPLGAVNICSTSSAADPLVCNGFKYDTATCATCACTNCAALQTSCSSDANCKGFFTCYLACAGNDTCQNDCVTGTPALSKTLVSNTVTCLGNSCGTCTIPTPL